MAPHATPGLLLAALLAFTGCGRTANHASVIAAQPAPASQAQPALPTIKLWLGSHELTAEIAASNEQRMAGMMFRTNMAENAGMLFVFPYPHQTAFWMKNTPLPLSAAYIDPEGVIRELHELRPFNTNTVMATSDRIQFVLEVNQGWFQRHGVSAGVLVRTERGSLLQSFRQPR